MFAQSCSRQLVTVDLNLTNAEFIQFYFMYGCMIPPSNRNQGVLLEYSLNGGINWHLLTEIFYDLYTKPGSVVFKGRAWTQPTGQEAGPPVTFCSGSCSGL